MAAKPVIINVLPKAIRYRVLVRNTTFASYHYFFYLFDIFTSNSLNCLLAAKRLRRFSIVYSL